MPTYGFIEEPVSDSEDPPFPSPPTSPSLTPFHSRSSISVKNNETFSSLTSSSSSQLQPTIPSLTNHFRNSKLKARSFHWPSVSALTSSQRTPPPTVSSSHLNSSSFIEHFQRSMSIMTPTQSKAYTEDLKSINECRKLFESDFETKLKQNELLIQSAIQEYEQAQAEHHRLLELQRKEEARIEAERLAEKERKLKKQQEEEQERELERQRQLQLKKKEEEEKEKENQRKQEQERLEALVLKEQKEKEAQAKTATSLGATFSSSSSSLSLDSDTQSIQEHQQSCLNQVLNIKHLLHHPDPKYPLPSDYQRQKMQLNRSVGQITNTYDVIHQVAHKLMAQLNVADSFFLDYHVAKCFTAQACTEIGRSITRAYAFAHVINILGCSRPSVVTLLYGLMLKKCPYLLPKYPHQIKFKPNESMDAYLERMGGLVALFAACLASTPLNANYHNPFEFKLAWYWLASILNQPPQPETAFLLRVFLKIAGHRGMEVYGRQAHKLVHFLVHQYLPLLPSSSIAENERLSMFLDSFKKRGTLEKVQESTPSS